MLLTIILFILILSLVVLIHELGHFLTAKKFGVKVTEFGIGFPPRICKIFTWQGTDFTLNWLPLGGFCAMEGEASQEEEIEKTTKKTTKKEDIKAAENETINVVKSTKKKTIAQKNTDKSGLFEVKTTWQKILIILAGPVFNFILGALAFVIIFAIQGIPSHEPTQVIITHVQSDSPADLADLTPDLQIYSLTNSAGSQSSQITKAQEVVDFVQNNQGQEIILQTLPMTCQNPIDCPADLQNHTIILNHLSESNPQTGALGITMSEYGVKFYPWYQHLPLSIYHGFIQSFQAITELLSGLISAIQSLFLDQESQIAVMGPVGIVTQLEETQLFQNGIIATIQFIGILSLNLGVINLLPLPALDGGTIILLLIEKFLGKAKVGPVRNFLNYFGLIALILLSIIITGQDIWRIFSQN